MGFLTGIEIRNLISGGGIIVESLDPRYPFSPDYQITEDCIDLRLSPLAMRYKKSVKRIDYLKEDDLSNLFDFIQLSPDTGYELRSGELLFTQTLEAITIPNSLVGLVVTRSSFARLGLMVNCMAPKFATGISWAFPLQIVNCNNIPLIIYPYSLITQLMLSNMQGEHVGYKGRYQRTYSLIPPIFTDREKKSLNDIASTASTRTIHILTQEIESKRKQLELEYDSKVKELSSKSDDSRTKKRKPISKIVRTMVGIIGGLLFGIVGNLLSEGDFSYWKIVSLVLMTIISLSLVVGSILFPNADSIDW